MSLTRKRRQVRAELRAGADDSHRVEAHSTFSALKHQDTRRWWALRHPDSGAAELVKSLGVVERHGPFDMVAYVSQDGAPRQCSLDYFEANAHAWQPGTAV